MAAQRKLRVAVAGLGFGASVHVPGLRRIGGVEVCAIAGSSALRTAQIAEQLGVPAWVTDYHSLIDLTPDAVTLALPPDVGGPAAEYFIAKGVPVLTEKPIAADEAGAKRLALSAGSLPCAVDFQFRELGAFVRAREALRKGAIGGIRHIHLDWMVESQVNRENRASWKSNPARSAGVVSLLVSHVLYLLEWMSNPVKKISAKLQVRGALWKPGMQFAPDTAHLTICLATGAVASAVVSNASPGMSIHRWEIVGDEGTLFVENATQDYMAGFRAELRARSGVVTLCKAEGPGTEDGRIEPFARLAARFLDCVRTGAKPEPNLEDGWRVQRGIGAVLESAERGVPVEVCRANGRRY